MDYLRSKCYIYEQYELDKIDTNYKVTEQVRQNFYHLDLNFDVPKIFKIILRG